MARRYTVNGEWIEDSGKVRKVGLSVLNADELGEITYLGKPSPGTKVEKGQPILSLEAAKAALDLYAPVDLTVVETNPLLENNMGLITKDPLGEGWIVAVRTNASDLDTLLSEEEFLAGRGASDA